jgi:outer membrane protein assembly factor BamB
VTSYDHHVYAIDTTTGAEVWRFNTGDIVYTSVATGNDGSIYVGSRNGVFYSLDPLTGTENWRFSTGSAIGSSAAIDINGHIYVGAADGFLYSLDNTAQGRGRQDRLRAKMGRKLKMLSA